MTYLYNDPQAFTSELIDGFVAAYPDRVARVSGGVVRATAVPEGQVAVVIGGGTGHYPAFAGLVGAGLAHGAAMGNVFASPSAQQVYQVAKAAHHGGGVLLTYGNYAGDVLNFDEAQRRLTAEGIACQTVTVTDDISSAAPTERHRRRGIAGDLCVFKAAAYLAEQGASLAEVQAIAQLANERTRSFGVAFSGCSLPGAAAPLFEIPPGQMGVGMGIHGEPGLRQVPLASANDVAELLVAGLLAELPAGIQTPAGQQVAVLTNGLGSVKYEELFVLHRRIDQLLREAGVAIFEPEVGELCTSFDMAGVSLTLCWLNPQLQEAWAAPVDTPAYRKGSMAPRRLVEQAPCQLAVTEPEILRGSTDPALALAALTAMERTLTDHIGQLGDLDAIAGDGDHGIGMQRGVRAALERAGTAAAAGAGLGTTLTEAGRGWAEQAGGTSGALWGCILRALGEGIGDNQLPSAQGLAAAVTAAQTAVMHYGKAEVGDKTLLDVLVPFAQGLRDAAERGSSVRLAWAAAAEVASSAATATASLVPKIGRARPHAERSLGSPDPGAVSLAHIITAVGAVFEATKERA